MNYRRNSHHPSVERHRMTYDELGRQRVLLSQLPVDQQLAALPTVEMLAHRTEARAVGKDRVLSRSLMHKLYTTAAHRAVVFEAPMTPLTGEVT